MIVTHTFRWLIVLSCLLMGNAIAQVKPPEVSHKYLGQPLQWAPAAYLTNLQSGQTVQSPFVVKFGMSFWGIAPAEHDLPRTGHHHLLIDKNLPMGTGHAIPTDANHVHFGKGQMEYVVNLAPGKHTLRLLLADYKHIPTYVYSKEYEVNVAPGPSDLPANYGKVPRLELLNLADQSVLITPFKLNFHASGLNVAALGVRIPGSGHFRLDVAPIPKSKGKTESIAFVNGQTEAWLSPPEGDYELTLHYIKNDTEKVLETASEPRVIKVKTGGLSKKP